MQANDRKAGPTSMIKAIRLWPFAFDINPLETRPEEYGLQRV